MNEMTARAPLDRTAEADDRLDESLGLDHDGPDIPLGRLLHDAARLRRYAFDVLSEPSGLTRAQYSILAFLDRTQNPGPTQTELANALRLGKVTLGVTLERLEDKRFIRRKLAPQDRRVKTVFLTAEGRNALNRVALVPSQIDELMLRGLEPGEKHQLIHAMVLIRKNLLSLHDDQKFPSENQRESISRKRAA